MNVGNFVMITEKGTRRIEIIHITHNGNGWIRGVLVDAMHPLNAVVEKSYTYYYDWSHLTFTKVQYATIAEIKQHNPELFI